MEDSVQVYVLGGPQLMEKLNSLSGFLKGQSFRSILEDAGMAYTNLAKSDCPISRNPGATGLVAGGGLRGSINYVINDFGGENVNVTITAGGPPAPYAAHVEFGTQSSMRIPINKQVMFWVEDGAGRKVQVPWHLLGGQAAMSAKGYMAKFRHIVWHPGTRAQPFFFKQMDIVIPRLMSAMQRAIEAEWNKQNI